MRRLTTLKAIKLADTAAEESRRNTHQAIAELQSMVERDIIKGVVCENGVYTRVPHRLGRVPSFVTVSPIHDGSSSAGRILEIRDSNAPDRTKAIVLYVTGYTTTITVDVRLE